MTIALKLIKQSGDPKRAVVTILFAIAFGAFFVTTVCAQTPSLRGQVKTVNLQQAVLIPEQNITVQEK